LAQISLIALVLFLATKARRHEKFLADLVFLASSVLRASSCHRVLPSPTRALERLFHEASQNGFFSHESARILIADFADYAEFGFPAREKRIY